NQCPVTYCLSKIGGKWKPIILFLVSKGANRFGIMQRGIVGISKQMLAKQLKELVEDDFLHKEIFAQIPPKVVYSLTERGQSLMPIISSMRQWGEENMLN
ncbi:MAG: helix-turn-helix domain-containing protein, partial [Bacteroidota bacterium]